MKKSRFIHLLIFFNKPNIKTQRWQVTFKNIIHHIKLMLFIKILLIFVVSFVFFVHMFLQLYEGYKHMALCLLYMYTLNNKII